MWVYLLVMHMHFKLNGHFCNIVVCVRPCVFCTKHFCTTVLHAHVNVIWCKVNEVPVTSDFCTTAFLAHIYYAYGCSVCIYSVLLHMHFKLHCHLVALLCLCETSRVLHKEFLHNCVACTCKCFIYGVLCNGLIFKTLCPLNFCTNSAFLAHIYLYGCYVCDVCIHLLLESYALEIALSSYGMRMGVWDLACFAQN